MKIWANIIPRVLYWMLISQNLQSEAVGQLIKEFFVAYSVTESDYIPCTRETAFFSKSLLRKSNGVKIYILASPILDDRDQLEWKSKLMSDDKRYKSSSTYGEQNMQAFFVELRMEVFLRFIRQVQTRILGSPNDLFMSLLAGRKAVVAATVSFSSHSWRSDFASAMIWHSRFIHVIWSVTILTIIHWAAAQWITLPLRNLTDFIATDVLHEALCCGEGWRADVSFLLRCARNRKQVAAVSV
jgi:hypothetical protein